MSFIRYIAVLEVLADSPTGATVGFVQSMNLTYTHTQIKKTLRELVGEGMATVEGVQYRPHIVSSKYHITEKAIEHLNYVMSKFLKHERQQEIRWEAAEQAAAMADADLRTEQ